MPFCEGCNGLLALVVDVKPSWRLWNEVDEQDDEAREDKLKPDGQEPRGVVVDVQAAPNGTASKDRSGEPEGVAVSGNDTTVCGVRGLDDVDWTRGRDDRNTETEQETPTHELMNTGVGDGSTGDDGAHDDQKGANEHTHPSSPGVDCRSHEGKSADTTNLVHGRDQTSPDTVVLSMKEGQEVCLVRSETTEQRTIKPVHRLTEASEEQAAKESESGWVPEAGRFFDHSLVVGLATSNGLDFGHIFLGQLSVV